MNCLAGDLRSKMHFSVATVDTSNMNGRLQGAVTRFEGNALPNFYFEYGVPLTSST